MPQCSPLPGEISRQLGAGNFVFGINPYIGGDPIALYTPIKNWIGANIGREL